MIMKRFIGKDLNEAFRMAKKVYGGEAIILSSKKVRKDGIRGYFSKKSVEIVVGIEEKDNKFDKNDKNDRNDKNSKNELNQSNQLNELNELNEKNKKIDELEKKVDKIESLVEKCLTEIRAKSQLQINMNPTNKALNDKVSKVNNMFLNNLVKNEIELVELRHVFKHLYRFLQY